MSRYVAAGLLVSFVLVLVTAIGLTRTPTSELGGVVVAPDGGVDGAHVRLQAHDTVVRANRHGRFVLPASSSRKKITAAKEGFFIASIWSDDRPLHIRLNPLPAHDHDAYAWIDPTPNAAQPLACGNCHAEIFREWNASGHARSATNPRLLNLYDGSTADGRLAGWSLLREHPDGAGVCAACHAPTLEPSASGDYDLRRARNASGLSGVHCDYCHKVQGPARGDIGLTHGRFGLQLLRPEHGQLFSGPLDDVDRGEDAWSPFQRDSRYCASCHEGVVFGVPVYTTYSEWRESPAAREGKQCQDCHMKPTGRMSNFAPGHGGIERDPKTLANHRFLDDSLTAMLQRSLQLQVDAERSDGVVQVRVTLRADNVGHRVPTGFVDRNLVLVVEAFDQRGQLVRATDGPVLPTVAGPNFAGHAGRMFAKQLRDFDGKSPAPFWRAEREIVDTRLKPGFNEVNRHSFPNTATQVRVRLLYRRFWPEVAAIKGWAGNEIEVALRERNVHR